MAYYGAAAGGATRSGSGATRSGGVGARVLSPVLLAEANAHVARSLVKLARAKTTAIPHAAALCKII